MPLLPRLAPRLYSLRLYLIKAVAVFTFAVCLALSALHPSQAQYPGGGYPGGGYPGSGGWVPCDASGSPLPAGSPGLNPDGSAALVGTGKTPSYTNTYPIPAGAAAWWFSAYGPNPTNSGGYPGGGGGGYPGASGLGLSGYADNYAADTSGGQHGYYDPVSYGGDRPLPSPPNVTGGATASVSDTLSAHFLWTGPAPVPASATFLVAATASAGASAGYGNSGQTSGLSGTGSASAGGASVTATAGDAGSAGSPAPVTAYQVVTATPSGSVATVSLPASVSTSTSDTLAYASWTGSTGDSYYAGPGAGPTAATANAHASGSVKPTAAGVQGLSTADTAGWDPASPRFFSGTDCSAAGTAVAVSGSVLRAQLVVGGTVVAEYDDATAARSTSGVDPNTVFTSGTSQASVPLSVHFDSTHFASGTPVTVALRVRDTNNNFYPVAPISAPAVNNAFLMYNNNQVPYGQTGSVDDSSGTNQAQKAADAVAGVLATPSHIKPSAEDYTDNVAGIEGKLSAAGSQYTVFFAAGHGDVALNGNPYVLGDCVAVPTNADVGDWLTDAYISSSVQAAAKSPTQPPYNFVYLHTCDSGTTSGFAADFGIPVNSSDRGMMGFVSNTDGTNYNATNHLTPPGYAEDGELAVSQQNTTYTQKLWQLLMAGRTPAYAIQQLFSAKEGAQEWYEPTQQGQQGVLGANNTEIATLVVGDENNFTLAGAVYSGSPGQWFK